MHKMINDRKLSSTQNNLQTLSLQGFTTRQDLMIEKCPSNFRSLFLS